MVRDRTRTVEVSWHAKNCDDEYVVTVEVTPGTPKPHTFTPSTLWVPGDEDEVLVVTAVRTDPGGLDCPNLRDFFNDHLDEIRDQAVEEFYSRNEEP